MIIRQSKPSDVEELVELGARMHEESAYAHLPYDAGKVRRLIASSAEESDTQLVLVAEAEGQVIGMLSGYLTDYFFCDETVACDMALFVEKGHRRGGAAVRLIRGFQDWARRRGAREVYLAVSTGVDIDVTGRFYEKMGFSRVGAVYKQRLDSLEG